MLSLKKWSIHSKLLMWFFAGMLISGCSDEPSGGVAKSGKSKGRAAAKPIPVEVAIPELGMAASYYVTTATLAPSSDAQINSRTSGVVRQILREEGDDVKAGEILLLLEDDDQRLRLKQAKQKFASAEREFKRLSKMKTAGAVSPTEWETANNNFLTSKTDVELAELALSYTQIAAPFDGRVVWREVDLGAHVQSGNLLFRMMSINPLLVRVHVPANRIGKVAKGQIVDLNVDSALNPLQGVVDLVSPIVDPTTGTVKVTVKVEDYPSGVRPGDFTEVRMITDQRDNAFLLPSVALIEERGQHYLFFAENDKAVRKKVSAGYIIGSKTEIIDGVGSGDRIVVKGQRNLNDGNPLKVISNGASDEQNISEPAKKNEDMAKKRTSS